MIKELTEEFQDEEFVEKLPEEEIQESPKLKLYYALDETGRIGCWGDRYSKNCPNELLFDELPKITPTSGVLDGMIIDIPFTETELKEQLQGVKEAELQSLRKRRESECFTVINRGQLWYDTLATLQKLELGEWYAAWLTVTETLIVPDKPLWLS